jgi:hypothetical protein
MRQHAVSTAGIAHIALGQTEVRLELETRGPEHISDILEELERAGYGAELER